MAERSDSDDPDYVALVRGLLKDLSGTSITRLELRSGDLHVALRREPGAAPMPATPEDVSEEESRPDYWHAVEAPLTGIYYDRPEPDEESYVQVGSHVEADSVVGLIETMKMFNPVTADVAGIVREITLENGSLVEAGHPILFIEPGDGPAGPHGGGA